MNLAEFVKQQEVRGTFNSNAFQLSLKNKDGCMDFELFDFYGFPCVTMCGVYGEEYEPLIPVALLELPESSIYNYYSDSNEEKKDNYDLQCLIDSIDPTLPTKCYAMIHPKPKNTICQHITCDNLNEMNIMFHPWVYKDIVLQEDTDTARVAEVGLFCVSDNVQQAHMDNSTEEFRGMPFNCLGPRSVCIHSMRFSPANCEVLLLDLEASGPCYSFFSLARYDKRQILVYHIVPPNEQLENVLVGIAENSVSLLELLNELEDQLVPEGITQETNDILKKLVAFSFKGIDENLVERLQKKYSERKSSTFAESGLAYIF